jgi:hypothetical protein
MIDKNLEVKFHNGSMTNEENKIFFSNMTKSEMFNFSEKVYNALWDKSNSSKSMAWNAENNIIMAWYEYHPNR